MSNPICSIIIPSRNCIQYLPTALATVDLQFRDDLEVILVDDGSTDATADWARARAKSSFALNVLETGGVGPGAARNAGIAAATAPLIAFLDADDQWWPGKLARQIAYHRANPSVGLSFTDYIHMTLDGRTHGTCFEFFRQGWVSTSNSDFRTIADAEAKLLADNLIGTSTVVADRSVLDRVGGFSPNLKSGEDWDLWLRMAAAAPVACSSAVTMTYLMRPASESANRELRIAALRQIVDRYATRLEPAIKQALRHAYAQIAIDEAEAARATGDHRAAAALHFKATLLSPEKRTARAALSDAAAAAATLVRSKLARKGDA